MAKDLQYRPDIDGLRAVAVVPVVLFHAGVSEFSGGYVGVDVFFVLSGFLITSILANGLENGSYSIVDFYERRARRILPALTLVLLASIPLAWLYLPPRALDEFARSLAATTLFGSNFLFWSEAGYFDGAAELKPLLHTWSLAVEEQFYVLFPLMLAALWSFGRRVVIGSIVGLTVASLALSHWGAYSAPNTAFYLLPMRAWELFFGALAALYIRTEHGRAFRGRPATWFDQIASAIGLVLIAVSIAVYDKTTPFPGLYALVPVLGTTLVVLTSRPGTAIHYVLSRPLFVGIGLISYSLYLWHQPLLAFFRYANLRELEGWEIFGFSLVLGAVSFASWRFVEQPFRNRKKYSRRRIFSLAAQTSAGLLILGVIGWRMDGFQNRDFQLVSLGEAHYEFDNAKLRYESWSVLRDKANQSDWYGIVRNAADQRLWFDLEDPRQKLLIVGNSLSKDLFNVLHFSETATERYEIARFGVQIYDLVSEPASFYQAPNYQESDVVVICSFFGSQGELDAFASVAKRIQDDGKRVVFINNIVEFYDFHDFNLSDQLLVQLSNEIDPRRQTEDMITAINEAYFDVVTGERTDLGAPVYGFTEFPILAEQLDIPILDRMDLLCRKDEEICFAIGDDFRKHMYDFAHYTLDGSKFFAQRVDELDWLAPISE